jgi:hypothetical protein
VLPSRQIVVKSNWQNIGGDTFTTLEEEKKGGKKKKNKKNGKNEPAFTVLKKGFLQEISQKGMKPRRKKSRPWWE